MPLPAPPIDERSAESLAEQTELLLDAFAHWKPRDDTDPGHGLVRIFAHLAELVVSRLNKVPDKNFRAYLDLLGGSLLPPQPARVPLTFTLASGNATTAPVPADTQVTTTPEGPEQPVIFETERDLVVTVAELASIIVHDPALDCWQDWSRTGLTSADGAAAVPIFGASTPAPHALYIGIDDLLSQPNLRGFSLGIQLESGSWPAVQWEIWDGKADYSARASTHGIRRAGSPKVCVSTAT